MRTFARVVLLFFSLLVVVVMIGSPVLMIGTGLLALAAEDSQAAAGAMLNLFGLVSFEVGAAFTLAVCLFMMTAIDHMDATESQSAALGSKLDSLKKQLKKLEVLEQQGEA